MHRFWNSLQFKIPAVFIVAFVLVLVAIFAVFSTIGKNLLQQQAHEAVVLSGKNMVAQLGKRIALAESLATALANLGETLEREEALTRKVVEHVMNYEGMEAFIAGGGLWPEPHRFDPEVERRSFFWGRDANGVLRYYDDYNDPAGSGYHHEEWYVPARYLRQGEVFWSKSYMDPYSYQPMVTVTVPMFRDQSFYGVATIDLKLEGLKATLAEISKSFGGYAFAVDRNGKFLSFPDESLTKIYGIHPERGPTEEFIDVNALAAKGPEFEPLAAIVNSAIEQVLSDADALQSYDSAVGRRIAEDSYQVGEREAQLIAAVLAVSREPDRMPSSPPSPVLIKNDILLGEPVFAAIFDMPVTAWKIVAVMPYSEAVKTADLIYVNLISAMGAVMLVSLLLMLMIVRRVLVKPVADMSKQLQLLAETPDSEHKQLEVSDRGELGRLAFWFNRRSQQLLQVQSELRQIQEELEQRVADRTAKLEQEIQRRRLAEAARDERVARVERQHLAIVDLSLKGAEFEGDVVAAARAINEIAAQVLGVSRSSVWLINEAGTVLEAVDQYEVATGTHERGVELILDHYPAYYAELRTQRYIAVSDVLTDERTRDLRDYARHYGIAALLDSPVRMGGELCGVLCFGDVNTGRQWEDDEIRFAGEIADQFVQVLGDAERARSEAQIRKLAFYDPLTGLANRRLLQETLTHELEVARRHGVYGALVYLDLDNFKTLNDSLGHHVGDELLAQLSERLRAALRREDVAARLGGDEFVVLITGETDSKQQAAEAAMYVAKKIQNAICTPYRLHGYEHTVTSSIGITLYPEDGASGADVLRQADTAMYRAKEEGRNSIRFYNEQMQAEADNRLRLEKELREGLRQNQFEIYLQPQVDCRGELVAAEALVRWNHPAKGLVSPAKFIPVAEETGLILDLGAWILRQACDFSKQCELCQIAVNISPMEFRQQDFIGRFARIVQETGVDASRLTIELTESIVIENIADTVDKMHALKEMGVQIAIDDFGTGYSSLAYLKRLPIDQLKVSNEFVRDITVDSSDAVIVDTILSMARHLGLAVVAEGVETREQLDFLEQKGCPILQGHYFSQPLSAAAFRDYVARRLPKKDQAS